MALYSFSSHSSCDTGVCFFVVVVVVVVVVVQQSSKTDRQTAILSPGPQHILVHSPDYMYLQLYLTLLSRYV